MRAILPLLALCLVHCGNDTGPLGGNVIAGAVLDSVAGTPAQVAWIRVGDDSVQADELGHYRLTFHANLPATLTVTQARFETRTMTISRGGDLDILLRRLAPFIPSRGDSTFAVMDLQGAHSIDWSDWSVILGANSSYVVHYTYSQADVTYDRADTLRATVRIPAAGLDNELPFFLVRDADGHPSGFQCPNIAGPCEEMFHYSLAP
jgi:hypothetical protein